MDKKKNNYETKYLISRGIRKAEAEALLERIQNGIFKAGDVLYIPSFTIIDTDPYTKEYGRAHDIENHLFAVVDTKEMNFLRQDSDYLFSAASNVQLALVDGVHNRRDFFKMVNDDANIYLPKGRAGIDNRSPFFIHCDRLILSSSEMLLNHEVNLTAVIKDPLILDRMKFLSFSKGLEKINDINLEWVKEIELNENGFTANPNQKTDKADEYKERY